MIIKKVSLRSKDPIKCTHIKLRRPPTFSIDQFSSVKRVVGSSLNLQSAVNTYAVLLLALLYFLLKKRCFLGGKGESGM